MCVSHRVVITHAGTAGVKWELRGATLHSQTDTHTTSKHTHTHTTNKRTHLHTLQTHTHTYTQTIHIKTQICPQACTCIKRHMHSHTQPHALMHTHISRLHTDTSSRRHINLHGLSNTCTEAHKYTHTHTKQNQPI